MTEFLFNVRSIRATPLAVSEVTLYPVRNFSTDPLGDVKLFLLDPQEHGFTAGGQCTVSFVPVPLPPEVAVSEEPPPRPEPMPEGVP